MLASVAASLLCRSTIVDGSFIGHGNVVLKAFILQHYLAAVASENEREEGIMFSIGKS